ncbi:MAG TPA: HAD family hydrolase [Candidatus Micrarchaeaceae archaeon]|nr:HAD family hydrolase [Candidatus Micrarchaeaceae archaeon]
MPIKVLAFDGDDTLWHNESRFNVTQGELRELVRRHVPDADVDGHLFEVEMQNLTLYGYGIKAFTLSMLETAIQLTGGRIPAADLEVILGWGKQMLTAPTELLDGVEEALRSAGEHYSLLLVTKGDLFDQESKLARSGLAEMFSGVEILSDKTVDSYLSLLNRRDITPDEFVMVGNSLRSDIAPVVTLGARAVHIPYPCTWNHEQLPAESLPPSGWYRLGRIGALATLLETIDQASAREASSGGA